MHLFATLSHGLKCMVIALLLEMVCMQAYQYDRQVNWPDYAGVLWVGYIALLLFVACVDIWLTIRNLNNNSQEESE